MNIQDEENYSLTPEDMYKIIGYHCPLIKYPDLINYDYNKFLRLFSNIKNGFIVFFETVNSHVGHYECCFRNGQGLNFFDAYGLYPDKAESFLTQNTRIRLKETQPLLTKLFDDCMDHGWTVRYNVNKFQNMNSNISTCGRWCAIRLKNSQMTDNQFLSYIESIKKRFNAQTMDEAVTRLTINIIGK